MKMNKASRKPTKKTLYYNKEHKKEAILESTSFFQQGLIIKNSMHTQMSNEKKLNLVKKIPQNITYDKESLYENNQKLKEKIKHLQIENYKLQTRVNISDKEKEEIMAIYRYPYENQNQSKSKIYFNTKSSIKKKSLTKKVFRQTKDQLQILKAENQRLRNSAKCTKIAELQIENQRILEETARLQSYLRLYIEAEREKENILYLKEKNEREKNQLKMALSKKNQECEKLKLKFLERDKKKPNKQFNKRQVKKQIIGTEQSRRKFRKVQKYKAINTQECMKCSNLQTKIDNLQRQIKEKDESILKLKETKKEEIKQKSYEGQPNILNQSFESAAQQMKIDEISHIQNSFIIEEKDEIVKSEEKKNEGQLKENEDVKQKKVVNFLQPKKVEEVDILSMRSENESDILYLKEENEEINAHKKENVGVLSEEERRKENQIKVQNEQKKNEPNILDFQQKEEKSDLKREEDVLDLKEEDILDLKSEKNSENKIVDEKDGKRQEEILDLKEENSEPVQESQARSTSKINIMKETVTYKLAAQRYTMQNFSNNIKESEAKEFSIEDVRNMLTSEPFFLSTDQIQIILHHCFQTQQLHIQKKISQEGLLSKFSHFIDQFVLQSEEEEEALKEEIVQELSQQSEPLLEGLKKLQDDLKTVSKKDFMHVLKYIGKLNDKKIQFCMGQACLLSLDINHLNYKNFLKRFTLDRNN